MGWKNCTRGQNLRSTWSELEESEKDANTAGKQAELHLERCPVYRKLGDCIGYENVAVVDDNNPVGGLYIFA